MTEDISKQFLWSRPSFESRDEEVQHLYKTYSNMMTTESIPPLPSREQEINYLKWLEKSFSEDPIVTLHPKFYEASPYRLAYRYRVEARSEYRWTFMKNFAVSIALSWPLIIFIANRRRYHSRTGVPITYLRTNLFTPDYRLPDSYYNETARRKFTWGVLKYSIIFGLVGSYMTTDSDYMNDDLNIRPDFKGMRNLASAQSIPIKEKKVFEMMHGNYFGIDFKEKNTSIWKKTLHYFYPYYDYNPDRSYYEPFFDYKKDYVTENMNNHYHFNL